MGASREEGLPEPESVQRERRTRRLGQVLSSLSNAGDPAYANVARLPTGGNGGRRWRFAFRSGPTARVCAQRNQRNDRKERATPRPGPRQRQRQTAGKTNGLRQGEMRRVASKIRTTLVLLVLCSSFTSETVR
jgi:hypothetical protein